MTVWLAPNVFKTVMHIIVDDLNPPCHRINGDGKDTFITHPIHQRTRLLWFPWFDLWPTSLDTQRQR